DADLGVEIGGRDGEAHSDIRLVVSRLVPVIERISRNGSVPFERGVVSELDQLARNRIDLRGGTDRTAADRQQARPAPPIDPSFLARHAFFYRISHHGSKRFARSHAGMSPAANIAAARSLRFHPIRPAPGAIPKIGTRCIAYFWDGFYCGPMSKATRLLHT